MECDFLGQACGREVEKIAVLHFSSVIDRYSLKNIGERIARYQNHVTFLLKCRQKGVIPKGLVLLLPVNSAKGCLIADRASRALLRERIRHVRPKKVRLEREIRAAESKLRASVGEEKYQLIQQWTDEVARKTYETTKAKQKEKLKRLLWKKSDRGLTG